MLVTAEAVMGELLVNDEHFQKRHKRRDVRAVGGILGG